MRTPRDGGDTGSASSGVADEHAPMRSGGASAQAGHTSWMKPTDTSIPAMDDPGAAATLDGLDDQPSIGPIDFTADELGRDWFLNAILERTRSAAELALGDHAMLTVGPAETAQRPAVPPATQQPQIADLSPAQRPPLVLAGLQLLLGYAWLVAGVDKILLGNFPAQLRQILVGILHGTTIPGFFAGFLRGTVLPNGALFGFMAEFGEALVGLGLIAAGLAVLVAPPLERRTPPALTHAIALVRRALAALGLLATIGAVLLGVTYYLLDGAPWQGFMPSVAFNGALDPGLFLALGSLVLLSEPVRSWLRPSSQPRHVSTPPARRARSDGR